MNKGKEKVFLWGAGKNAKDILNHKSFFQDYITVIGVVDSNSDKWGNNLCGFEIKPFYEISKSSFDKIIITSNIYFDVIREKIITDMAIDDSKIENLYYFAKVKLIARYDKSREKDHQTIVDFLKINRLSVFNYEFVKKYNNLKAEVRFDNSVGLFYVVHYGKKMYMARRLDTENKVLDYYRGICMEQDEQSPHVYINQQFDVQTGDVVADVGVAEGNFSLQIIDSVSKLYLIESDEEWVEALRYTFSPYEDKVVIINKFISDYVLGNTDTLDNIIDDNVNFLKLDIEGCECEALIGAKKLIKKSDKIKCALCAYHRDNDAVKIDEIAQAMGMFKYPSTGYMYYYNDEKQRYISPVLRRGVLRYEKKS